MTMSENVEPDQHQQAEYEAADHDRREHQGARRRHSTPVGLRYVGSLAFASALLVGATWGTSQLPHLRAAAPFTETALGTAGATRLPAVRVSEPAVVPLSPAARAAADSTARIAPLAFVLGRYSSDRALTRRIATAVLREAKRARIDPSLVVAVLVNENNLLKPRARNPVSNAQGLMQVMPLWAGRLGCPSSDLTDIDANICHGVRVLATHMKEARGDPREGLRRYNGCRRTEGSDRCEAYPTRVLARAERLEGQMETYAKRQESPRR